MTAAKKRREEPPARLSLVTAAVSGALVAALVAYLAVYAVRADRPAAIVTATRPAEAWTAHGIRYVPIDVTNLGDRSASQVVVEATVPHTGEARTSTIDYLAGGEKQTLYIALPDVPSEAAVTAHVVTFQEP